MAEAGETAEQNYVLPANATLQHIAKISIMEDKPVMFDYWTDSCDKQVLIGMRDNGEKLLVKSEDEYTSPIGKLFKLIHFQLLVVIRRLRQYEIIFFIIDNHAYN